MAPRTEGGRARRRERLTCGGGREAQRREAAGAGQGTGSDAASFLFVRSSGEEPAEVEVEQLAGGGASAALLKKKALACDREKWPTGPDEGARFLFCSPLFGPRGFPGCA